MTSTPDLSQLDPEEQLRRNSLAMRASVQPQMNTGAAGPVIAPPSVSPGLNLPPVGPVGKLGQDEAELSRLKSSPKFMGEQSGIASLKPQSTLGKIGKGILGGLDTIGSIATPGLMMRLPGTSLHHKVLESQAQGNVAEDVGQQEKQAQTQESTARAHQAEANAEATENAQPGAAATTSTAEGVKQWDPQTQRYDIPVGGAPQKGTPQHILTDQGYVTIHPDGSITPLTVNGKPLMGAPKPVTPVPGRDVPFPPDVEQQKEHIAQMSRAPKEPGQGSWQLQEDDKGQPIEFNTKTGQTQPAPAGLHPKGTFAKSQQITPAAQSVLQQTEPVKDQVEQLLKALEPYNTSNAGRLTMDRLAYALGEPSAPGELAAQISKLELNRVVDAARILRGSSRAYQALELALKHTPNPWVDKPQLMYQKLQNIRQNLEDVEKDAVAFGKKGQTVGEAQQQLSGGAKDLGPAPQGKSEGATGTMPDGTKVVVRNGRIVAQ